MQREYYIGFGFTILILAALTITFACAKVVEEKLDVIDSKEKSWSVNGTLNAGEKFFLYIVPPAKWQTGPGEAPTDDYPYGYIDVIIEIVDPNGNTTKFKFTWARMKNPRTETYYTGPANITLLRNGSLIDPGPVEVGAVGGCGGIANITGSYIARISDILPRIYLNENYSPPPTLQLIKVIPIEKYPNIYILWLGVPLLCFGFYLTVHPTIKNKNYKGKAKLKR